MVKIKGLHIRYPAHLDAHPMRAEEFETLLDALYAASPSDDGTAPRCVSLEFLDMLDEIYEARP
jgi:hypothetical protein